ncbi:hypothetical protein ACELLULO517_22685 [Acidisoma cellulosilytica]|uniref:Uncharacterized protein n=1 Tax=Acidisoma cellulosilyticum TaxID=2802395 RepID=A0A963Z753_9PROT|nr:hypothetical protein [Acidisoma cellulosilyticum]MCB8883073.1 hypothetical protein [Acidisoma cellulosilyticum]
MTVWLRPLLLLIAAITVLTGLTQLVAPAWGLSWIARGSSALSAQFFATVGMFMIITGAMFFQSLATGSRERVIPFWIGVQKAAACLLVALAVIHGLMSPLAIAVAAFDGLTAVITFRFWRQLRP